MLFARLAKLIFTFSTLVCNLNRSSLLTESINALVNLDPALKSKIDFERVLFNKSFLALIKTVS